MAILKVEASQFFVKVKAKVLIDGLKKNGTHSFFSVYLSVKIEMRSHKGTEMDEKEM